MNTNIYTLTLAIVSAIVLVIALPKTVNAADSNSYRLYDTLSDVSDSTPLSSPSYALDEGGGTWTDQPISGSNFQIVSGPPAKSSSSSSVQSSTISSDDTEQQTTPPGGSRGDRADTSTEQETDTPAESPDEEVTEPAAPVDPTLPAQVIDQNKNPVQQPSTQGSNIPSGSTSGGSGGGGTRATRSGTDGTRQWQVIDTPQYFDIQDEQACICPEPVHCSAANTITTKTVKVPIYKTSTASASMVLIAFLLGNVSHYARPGNVRNPFTKSKSQSKSKKKK